MDKKMAREIVESLPSLYPSMSAEEEEAIWTLLATDKNVGANDTISRQAALDIFDDYNVAVENGQIEAYSRDRKRLCDLPPAQPEPCEDAVSREEVLNCLEWQYPDKTPRTKIMELPPVTPKQRWIPCSERLPEVKQKVLVQYADGSMMTKRCNDAGHLQWFYANAVAWMPPPKPYEMEGDAG